MPTILIVDDSAVERRLVTGLLQKDTELQIETADSAVSAIERIRESPPDLIVTDLTMPDMSGLELLKEIRVHHSDLPVIIMTAHGTEGMAVRALQEGAASYVSKNQLNESLYSAVRQILSIAEANRNAADLMECLEETHFHFQLENDPELIDPLVRLVQGNVQGLNFGGETRKVQLGVALEQALLNALYRGNLEISGDQIEAAREAQLLGQVSDPVSQRRKEPPYCDRKIHVDVSLTPKGAKFVVRDEGPGFDVSRFDNLSTDAIKNGQSARGIVLMKALMDEVDFDSKGSQVTLVKYTQSEN